jgi:hypothetical protein
VAAGVLQEAVVAATNQASRIKKSLSSAACALLGTVSAARAVDVEGWEVDTSVLYYQEGDGRVSAVEPSVELKKKFKEGKEASLKLTLDALTGATPSGATASNVPQTFTRPSGNDSYTVAPGEIPLDDTFRDTRVSVSGMWKQPLNRLTLLNVGANFSKEYDFMSLGSSVMLSRDFNQKNTTLMLGVSTEFDQIDPVGNVPIPLASMAAAGALQPRQGAGESKRIIDVLLGVTQVINRRTLMQFNYSLSRASGYLNDPYKLLSVIDPVTGATDDIVYENRPDNRTKHALYWLTRFHLNRDVIGISYRYFFDDWGIKSHTIDSTYRWQYSPKQYFEPHVRLYRQTEADFFRVNLLNGEPLPALASADYRLAQFNGVTLGVSWGWDFSNASSLILRLEYYTQKGDSDPSSAVGIQKGLDLYPDLGATIAQIQYRF